jgi:hypothetical protein
MIADSIKNAVLFFVKKAVPLFAVRREMDSSSLKA